MNKNIQKIQSVLIEIAKQIEEENSPNTTHTNNLYGYNYAKRAIHKTFNLCDSYSEEDILTRITLIDSMYSTQMGRRYYGLEDLAKQLCSLSAGKSLENDFIDFISNKKTPKYNAIKELFDGNYGIGKSGAEKGTAVSLISKYAYFETGYQFPIYDSIVREMYPMIWKYCGFGNKMPNMNNTINNIVDFIECLNLLIDKLFVDTNIKPIYKYDIFDRRLWFVGNILRRNLVSILSKDEVVKAVKLS